MKNKIMAGVLLLSSWLLTACIDYDDVTHAICIKVQLQMPEEFTQGSDLEGHDIRLSLNGTILTAATDAKGIATFSDLLPDVYDISTAWELTTEQYQALTGTIEQNSGCTVSGSLNAQLLSEKEASTPLPLPTHVALKRDIVIGKIASAGSKDANNRTYMAGKYLELYNQADDSVDVSGLYIGLLETTSPQPFTLENLHEVYDDSVVVVKQVFQIPADKPYKVGPGGTVLLVNSATDHSDVNELEHNLTDADFESKDETGTTMNNPDTPALLTTFTVFSKNATMNLMQGGPCGVIIFRTNEDIEQWQHSYGYEKTTGTLFYLLVPKRVILDGVDYIKNKATGVDVSSKRLYDEIDAGYTVIESISGWTGEVVYRRTSKLAADGHKILMDTNNSLNDFKVSTTIKPREYDEANPE